MPLKIGGCIFEIEKAVLLGKRRFVTIYRYRNSACSTTISHPQHALPLSPSASLMSPRNPISSSLRANESNSAVESMELEEGVEVVAVGEKPTNEVTGYSAYGEGPNPSFEAVLRRLSLLKTQLSLTLDLTAAINANFRRGSLYEVYKQILTGELGIGSIVLYLHDEQWTTPVVYGLTLPAPAEPPQAFMNLQRPEQIGMGQAIPFPDIEWVIPVRHKDQPLAFLLAGALPWAEDLVKNEMTGYLQAITNILAVAIENKRLAKASENEIKLRHDLTLAYDMQHMLIPEHLPRRPGFAAAAEYKPTRSIGGDFYDCRYEGGGSYFFCVADVAGKGASAALLMATFQAHLTSLLADGLPLSELVKKLNLRLFEVTRGESYITAFLARWSETTQALEYVNCGHVPPVLVQKELNESEPTNVQFLNSTTTMLGMFNPLRWEDACKTLTLSLPATICAYTDGLSELERDGVAPFEAPGIAKLLCDNSHLSLNELMDELRARVQRFTGLMEDLPINLPDDLTVLTVRMG